MLMTIGFSSIIRWRGVSLGPSFLIFWWCFLAARAVLPRMLVVSMLSWIALRSFIRSPSKIACQRAMARHGRIEPRR